MPPREDSPIFSFGCVQHLLNEPPLFQLIKAGTYQRKFTSLEACIEAINSRYFPTDTGTYAQARSKFLSDLSTCPHLTLDQKISFYIYSRAVPPYFAKFNPVLYEYEAAVSTECDGAKPLDGLELWGDLALEMLQGMARLRAGPPDGSPPPKDSRLVRIAHIPDEVYKKFYIEGQEIVCRAFSSAAAIEQWQFVLDGQMAGHTPVVLEFDAKASEQAVDIRQLSYFGNSEDERVFPPYFRGLITRKVRTTNPLTMMELDRVCITGIQTSPPIPSVLDPVTCGPNDLLAAALLVGLHAQASVGEDTTSRSSILDVVIRIERAIQAVATPQGASSVERLYNEWLSKAEASDDMSFLEFLRTDLRAQMLRQFVEGSSPLSSLYAWGPFAQTWSPPSLQTLMALYPDNMLLKIASTQRWFVSSAKQVAARAELDRRAKLKTEALTEEQEKARKLLEKQNFELARKLAPEAGNPCFDQIARHHELYKSKLRSLPMIDKNEGVKDIEEREAEVFALWMRMFMQLQLMEKVVCTSEAAFDSPFPIEEAEMDVMLTSGDKLLASPESMAGASPTEVARYVVGNFGLLRQIMARSRIIFPLGLPDAGKSTFLKKVYGISCPAGLSRDGRTQAIALYPHPRRYDRSHAPIYIADVPGFGDVVAARNDISRMILSLACSRAFRANLVIMVFITSGRPVLAQLNELIQKMDAQSVPFEYFITKVDKVYEDRVEDKHKLFKEGQTGGVDMRNLAARQEVAQSILHDDLEQVCGKPYHYLCMAGWAADSDDDDDEIAQPRYKFIKKDDVRDFFKPMSAQDAGQHVDKKLDRP